jgi:hypothetical protein
MAAMTMADRARGENVLAMHLGARLVHPLMNSFRVLAGSGRPSLTANFGQELVGSVGPLDRTSPSIACGGEGSDAVTHVGGAVEVVGREGLPLQLAEHDLDLVEPGGVDGQSMEVDGERQVERRDPGRQTFRRMRGAIVQDQMQAANAPAPDASEEHPQEAGVAPVSWTVKDFRPSHGRGRVSGDGGVGAERPGGPPGRGATASSSARRPGHDAAQRG